MSQARAEEWFERWFGEEYKALYPHRDEAQAGAQVAFLVRALSDSVPRTENDSGVPSAGLPSSWRALDVGCGAGRHLRAFRAHGVPAFGVDLSAVLLRDARASGLDVARADMRRLPFRPGTFDLVGCFFTSFGYFATFEEDVAALAGFASAARAGGFLFIDIPNAAPLARALVPEDTSEWNGRRVDVRRALEGDSVVKRIRIHAGAGLEEMHREERVRLFSLDRLEPALRALGLETLRVFGDESGAAYDPEHSPRMSLLLRCPA